MSTTESTPAPQSAPTAAPSRVSEPASDPLFPFRIGAAPMTSTWAEGPLPLGVRSTQPRDLAAFEGELIEASSIIGRIHHFNGPSSHHFAATVKAWCEANGCADLFALRVGDLVHLLEARHGRPGETRHQAAGMAEFIRRDNAERMNPAA